MGDAVARPAVAVITTEAGESFTLQVQLGTVAALQQAIHERDGTPPAWQQLLCGADVLDDDELLCGADVLNDKDEALSCPGAAGSANRVSLTLVQMSDREAGNVLLHRKARRFLQLTIKLIEEFPAQEKPSIGNWRWIST